MNKIIQININGMVFSIDEHAYDELRKYLERLRAHFSKADGGLEIITDIEARIAELLQARLHEQKQVVGEADIKEVIAIMGDPLQMDNEEEAASGKTYTREEQAYSANTSKEKRLFRSEDDKVLGGVCYGIGAYFGVDPVWVRLAFAFSFFFFGTGFLLYIILWIVLPEAKTTAEKLQMRGEQVDINNIERKVRDELKDVEARLTDFASNSKPRAAEGLRSLVGFLVKVAVLIAKTIARVLGLFLALFSMFLFILVVSIILGLSWPISFSVFTYLNMLFANTTAMYAVVIGFVLFTIVPLMYLVYLGVRLLFHIPSKNKYFKRVSSSFFAAGLVLLIAGGVYLAKEFSAVARTSSIIPLQAAGTDTLYIDQKLLTSMVEDQDEVGMNGNRLMLYNEDTFLMEGIDLYLEESDHKVFELEQNVRANGRSVTSAREAAMEVNPVIYQNDSSLVFSSGYLFPSNGTWRAQRVTYTLRVPVGKTVIFKEGANRIDVHEAEAIANSVWVMTGNGLECLNCEEARTEQLKHSKDGWNNRNYKLRDFSAVEVHGVFEVHITKGDVFNVTVNAPEVRQLNHVSVEVKSGKLEIEMDEHHAHILNNMNSGKIEVHIVMPELNRLEATGASSIFVSGMQGGNLDVDLSGVSELEANNMHINQADISISGASKAEFTGTCTELKADLSGTSELNAEEFVCRKADISSSGACSAEVNPTDDLRAKASGVSHIHYKSGVRSKYIDVSGASSVDELD